MFSKIKYNLYEILNISEDSDEMKIRKSYLKLVKKFHPDKNNKLEEEIYFHIMYAYQILTDKEMRLKYNEFIKETNDFNSLKKQSLNSEENNISKISKSESLILFNEKVDILNSKHGYTDKNINIINKDREEIIIPKDIDPKSVQDFNEIFLRKKSIESFKDQIIEYKGEPMEISTYVIGDNYTFISDIDKLYIDDSMSLNSLDIAFKLQPFTEI